MASCPTTAAAKQVLPQQQLKAPHASAHLLWNICTTSHKPLRLPITHLGPGGAVWSSRCVTGVKDWESSALLFPAIPHSSSQKAKQRSRRIMLGTDLAQAFTPWRRMAVLDGKAGSRYSVCTCGLHRQPSAELQPRLQQGCHLFSAQYPHHPQRNTHL